MATIKDIAKLSGVGIGTVSRVLNGGTNVKAETMKTVLDAAKKLGFKPNSAARILARGNYARTTVGVVLPVIVHPFYFEIVKGIYAGLIEDNYNLMMFNTGNDRKTVFEHIVQESLPGLLVIALRLLPEEKRILELNQNHFIYVDYYEDGENCIFTDNYKGGQWAADYLIAKEAKNIIYIGDQAEGQQQNQRFKGFIDELKKKSVEVQFQQRVELTEHASYQATKKILIENPNVDGIFYFCDQLAYGGLKARKELGKSVHIVGYDDLLPSEYMDLSTIKQPAYEMGYSGAKRLIDMVNNGEEKKISICLPPELILRHS